jgi:ATP-dependent RNA helicase DeaD
MITSFKELPLHPQIIAALDKLGITAPTDIQSKAIPLLLDPKRVDFWGQAQTGTGKTLAFGIPLVQGIDASDRKLQALIVAPTRELVVQIVQSLRPIASPLGISIEAVYGGASMRDQMSFLKRGVHIVVGTPGRLNDHLNRKTLSLSHLKTLVLDEADIMLDMGFKEEMDQILEAAPAERQIWLFSATVKPGINGIMREHMRNTVSVTANKQQASTTNTKQFYVMVPMKNRFEALCRFIDNTPAFYGFIFCQTKILTAELAERLAAAGYPANALHGDMSQGLRNAVIKKFKNKEFNILVATDVAARGIDVSDLTHVINYSLPNDHESYVHRIGRTGRAGKEGTAISFIGGKNELRHLKMLERKFKLNILPLDVPSTKDIQKVYIKRAYDYLEGLASKGQEMPVEVKEAIQKYNKEELFSIVTALVAEKFFAQTKKEESQFNSTPSQQSHGAESSDDQPSLQEIMINLGTDDGITHEDIVDFIQQEAGISESDVEKLKVIKRRTFIKIPSEIAEEVLGKLKGKNVAGQKARIILAPLSDDDWALNPRGGDRRGGSDRRGGRGERSGGRRGGDRDRGERSERRGGDRGDAGRGRSRSRY